MLSIAFTDTLALPASAKFTGYLKKKDHIFRESYLTTLIEID